jgi:hypothetical protein
MWFPLFWFRRFILLAEKMDFEPLYDFERLLLQPWRVLAEKGNSYCQRLIESPGV